MKYRFKKMKIQYIRLYSDPISSGSRSNPIILIRILQKGSDPFGSGFGFTVVLLKVFKIVLV